MGSVKRNDDVHWGTTSDQVFLANSVQNWIQSWVAYLSPLEQTAILNQGYTFCFHNKGFKMPQT